MTGDAIEGEVTADATREPRELIVPEKSTVKPAEITIVVGSPMPNDDFSRLESHLLSQSPGRFVVIDAPGNVMGNRPYRISKDEFRIGFGEYETDLVIPGAARLASLSTLNDRELAELKRYYDGLKDYSRYTEHGYISVSGHGHLIFRTEKGLTKVLHSFPVNFLPVYVNGAALQRGYKSVASLGNTAAIRIGEDIKIFYGDNTPKGDIAKP